MPGGDDDIDSKAGKIQIQVQLWNTDTGLQYISRY